MRPRGTPITRTVGAVVAAVIFGVFAIASPAAAGGTAYSPYNWAGIRASFWNANSPDNPLWRLPTRVKATWQIPCLSTAADGVYGTYDQWIGIEGSDGTLIQAGVRSYHVQLAWGLFTGYYAWVVDTRDANFRTPQWVFPIARCGVGTGMPVAYPIVNAEVDAYGHIHIWASDTGTTGANYSYPGTGMGITSPAYPKYASFIIERFTSSSSNTMPWFRYAQFRDCWVGAGSLGWLLGNAGYVKWTPYYMASLSPHPPWTSANPAVIPGSPDIYGNFGLAQWITY